MNDDQLLRYSRHILLDEYGIEGQQRVLDGRVLVVGAGGLGSPACLYLAAAGVGRVTLADPDTVDMTNLQRQVAHTTMRIGQRKVVSARTAMLEINPDITVEVLAQRLDDAALDREVARADVVLDCSDNFVTRHAVNRACVKHARPLVAGAAIRLDAQVTVFDPRQAASPCYACVFPPTDAYEEALCSTLGVLGPLVGLVGSLQAAEALKLLSGVGESLAGRLLMIDARTMSFSEMRTSRQQGCPVCGTSHAS